MALFNAVNLYKHMRLFSEMFGNTPRLNYILVQANGLLINHSKNMHNIKHLFKVIVPAMFPFWHSGNPNTSRNFMLQHAVIAL